MNESDTPSGYTDLAVALGRIEEGQKGLKDSIDKLVLASDNHGEKIAEQSTLQQLLDQRVRTLEEARPKKTPWYTTGGFIIGIGGLLAAIGGVVVGLVQVADAVQHIQH